MDKLNYDIKDLIERYYECETTEDEENVLREYFRGDVEKEFEYLKPQFAYLDSESANYTPLDDSFDDYVIRSINNYESSQKLKKMSRKGIYYAAAASVVALFGIFYLMFRNDGSYKTDDYTATVDAFILISEKMDLATAEVQKLESFKTSNEEFDPFELLEQYGEKIINK
ncbi:hypothetical protein MASR1M45_22200 [Candidatus Kapaibacterium sp.]